MNSRYVRKLSVTRNVNRILKTAICRADVMLCVHKSWPLLRLWSFVEIWWTKSKTSFAKHRRTETNRRTDRHTIHTCANWREDRMGWNKRSHEVTKKFSIYKLFTNIQTNKQNRTEQNTTKKKKLYTNKSTDKLVLLDRSLGHRGTLLSCISRIEEWQNEGQPPKTVSIAEHVVRIDHT